MALTHDELSTLATDVATALGDGWSARITDFRRDAFYLTGPDGAELFASSDSYGHKSQLNIRASYPKTEAYDVKSVEINVGERRGAAVIAREITRRIMPDYLPELARVIAHNATVARNLSTRNTVAAELAQMLGDGARVQQDGYSGTSVRWYGTGEPSGTVRLNYSGESGSVDLSGLTVAQMRSIVTLITGTVMDS